MERRTFLAGGAAAAAGLVTQPAASHYYDNAWVKSPPGLPLAPSDLEAAVARLRKQFLAEFDAAYVENVIVPHFLVSVYEGEQAISPHDRCGIHQGERASLRSLGIAERDLEASAGIWRHRIPARTRKARSA